MIDRKPHYRLHCISDKWATYWCCLPVNSGTAWMWATWYLSSGEAIRRAPR